MSPVLPFVDAPGRGWGDGKISFSKPIGSVCVSGHKFLGTPQPCGVTMTRMRHAMKLSTDIEYGSHTSIHSFVARAS